MSWPTNQQSDQEPHTDQWAKIRHEENFMKFFFLQITLLFISNPYILLNWIRIDNIMLTVSVVSLGQILNDFRVVQYDMGCLNQGWKIGPYFRLNPLAPDYLIWQFQFLRRRIARQWNYDFRGHFFYWDFLILIYGTSQSNCVIVEIFEGIDSSEVFKPSLSVKF